MIIEWDKNGKKYSVSEGADSYSSETHEINPIMQWLPEEIDGIFDLDKKRGHLNPRTRNAARGFRQKIVEYFKDYMDTRQPSLGMWGKGQFEGYQANVTGEIKKEEMFMAHYAYVPYKGDFHPYLSLTAIRYSGKNANIQYGVELSDIDLRFTRNDIRKNSIHIIEFTTLPLEEQVEA